METEMERLRRNAELEKGKQTRDELVAYMERLDLEIMDRERWHSRARNLELVVLLTYLSSLIATSFAGVPYEQSAVIWDWAFITFIIAGMRSSVIHTQVLGAVREQIGVIKALRILGMIKDEDLPGPRRRVKAKKFSIFKKYQEFWERITEGQKQYA